MRKKALVISSSFPPHPNIGGTIRIAKLCKYLKKFDWDLHVVKSSKENNLSDNKLYEEIKDSVSVYSIFSFDLRILYVRLKSIFFRKIKKDNSKMNTGSKIPFSDRYLVPDPFIFWVLPAIFFSIYIGFTKKINIIYATAPSYSNLLVATSVSKLLNKPLIIDLRDPWTTNPFYVEKKFSFLTFIENTMEKWTFSSAKRIIVVSEGFIEPILKKYPALERSKFEVITNGFDPDDFKEIDKIQNNKKVLLHAGSFYVGRSCEPFLYAFSKLVAYNSEIKNGWILQLVGSGCEYSDLVKKLNLENNVKFFGKKTHDEAISYMVSSDALLLIPGLGASTLTGKIFEYMASQKPILTLSKEGQAKKIIAQLSLGKAVDDHNIDNLVSEIEEFFENIDSYKNKLPQLTDLNLFNREVLAKQISEIMESESTTHNI